MTLQRGALRGPTTLVLALALGLGLGPRPADAQFLPYYGKNKVRYDNFAWRIYKSPHFEVYYYPEFEQHLARLVSYLESAYQKISAGLKHEISHSIPVIFYKTHSEFEQTNLFSSFIPEQVAGFSESVRNRVVLPIDLPPDKLQGLITHEITHIFAFDLIPRGMLQRSAPLWVDEGLADYMEGSWSPLDLMQVRDAAVSDSVPRLSRAQFTQFSGRFVYNLGHSAFEYMEDRYGREGVRQFLYTLRKNVVGGNLDDIFGQAFRTTAEEFDKSFIKWLKERFKPYRDKERPDDYGSDLSPDSERTPYTQVFAFMPSPSGEMAAVFTGNRSDGEIDVLLLSTKQGDIIKNLTKGFTLKYESVSFSDNFVAGRSIDFSPKGDLVAFFGRSGKRRTLFLISALTGEVVSAVEPLVDQAKSPCLLADGRHALISAITEGVSDIYLLDLQTSEVTNLTQDPFYDSDPRISPDGKTVVYSRRVSGYDRIYAFPLAEPSRKTQLTFGTHDDLTPIFSRDGTRIYYASSQDDDIFNIRGLDVRTGVISQYTDVLGANVAPAPLPSGEDNERLAFISYHKSSYLLLAIETNEPLKEVDQEIQVASAEVIDFQPDVTHQVVPENKRRKRLFEGLYLEGRPPLNVGITSSGDFFGGSQVALTDVLGDQSVTFTAASIREFRSYSATYFNLARRLHWGGSVFDNTYFFFNNQYYTVPSYDLRQGLFFTQRITGATALGQYPLDKFRRLSFSAGAYKLKQQYEDPFVQFEVEQIAAEEGQNSGLYDGYLVPFSVELTQETTRFAGFGPLAGSTYSLGVEFAPSFGGSLSRTTFEVDARKYLRLGSTTALLATRVRGFYSTGDNPSYFYFGGNHELRGFPYRSMSGNKGFHANAELRIPLIDVMATPIGLLGPVRGTVFAGVGAFCFADQPCTVYSRDDDVSFVNYDPLDVSTSLGEPISGLHLVDGRASYGIGLQFFFMGYPLHFDFTKLTDLQVASEDTRFSFWMGFDF